MTEDGSVDILSDPAGAPPYEKLAADSVTHMIGGRKNRFSSLADEIRRREARMNQRA